MAEGDYYRVTAVSSCGVGDDILNIFWYQLNTDDAVPARTEPELCEALANDFSTEVVTPWLDVISNDAALVSLTVQHIGGVSFYSLPYVPPAQGNIVSEALPRYVSYNILLQRGTTATRHGHKRISGVPESWQDNGAFTGDNTDMGLFTTAMSVVRGIPGDDSGVSLFDPVIVRLDPLTGEPTLSNSIVGATFRGFGSQNSRKEYA